MNKTDLIWWKIRDKIQDFRSSAVAEAYSIDAFKLSRLKDVNTGLLLLTEKVAIKSLTRKM